MINVDQLVLACGYAGHLNVYQDYCYVSKTVGLRHDSEIALNSFTKFLLAAADPNLNCPDWENQILLNLNLVVQHPLNPTGFCDQVLIEELYNHFYN